MGHRCSENQTVVATPQTLAGRPELHCNPRVGRLPAHQRIRREPRTGQRYIVAHKADARPPITAALNSDAKRNAERGRDESAIHSSLALPCTPICEARPGITRNPCFDRRASQISIPRKGRLTGLLLVETQWWDAGQPNTFSRFGGMRTGHGAHVTQDHPARPHNE